MAKEMLASKVKDATQSVKDSMKSMMLRDDEEKKKDGGGGIGETLRNKLGGFNNKNPPLEKDIGTLHYNDLLPWNKDGSRETREFFNQLFPILMDFIEKTNDRNEKVIDFHHPDQLMDIMDLSLPEGEGGWKWDEKKGRSAVRLLERKESVPGFYGGQEAHNLDQLLTDCKDTLKYQVKTGHPHFFNQLSCGLDIIALAGEMVTATANANMFTYEIAPVFILMENFVLKKMREIIGFKSGDSILAPGGSISNLYAIIVARHKMFPDYKKNGLRALPKLLVMFTSELCHYSIKSAAMVTGLGTDNCVCVPADERGKMIPSELERLIIKAQDEGKQPYFVSATAGTTVFGAFDPINDIADICEKYGLWLHIDGAWGASFLLSRKYRLPRFYGVERADSISWNPHKLLTTVLQCSTIHFKESGLLQSCNSMCADYLFQQDKHYDVRYDTGDKVIQCGRHNDIFKFWLQWRAKGTTGLENHINHLMEIQEYMVEQIKANPHKFYLIVKEPEMVNVCFWYIPERLRDMEHGPSREKELGDITHVLKHRMMQAGTVMIGYQPQMSSRGTLPNFFRNIISSPGVKKEDIDFLFSEMEKYGHDL